MSYELHPLCTLFPRMSGAEFNALRDDIQAHGLRQPIVLQGGMILDGGNRYRACIEACVEPVFVEFSGANLVSFVLSANLHRRHLSAGQQAAIVASAQDWAKAQQPGRAGNGQAVDRFSTVADRAAASGVSRVTQMKADKVAKANPELARQVGHGIVSLPKALAKVENKPEKHPRDPQPYSEEDGAPSVEELLDAERVIEQQQVAFQRILDADDKLAEAMGMLRQRDALVEQLQWRINGLMNSNAELVSSVKYWRRQAEKAAA